MLTFIVTGLMVVLAACGGGLSLPTGGPPSSAPTSVPPLHPSVDGYPSLVVRLVDPAGGDPVEVAVKVADTPERRRHGLMEVESLPDGVGMLFVFPEDTSGSFWMKNTRIPLDIAFVAADGDIRRILRMQPCREDPCPPYRPDVLYRHALETPAGWFARIGVTESWRVEVATPEEVMDQRAR